MEVRPHPKLLKDLDQLSKKELEIFRKKKEKIKANPERQKHLSGGEHCYREPITKGKRLIYYVEGNTVWLLTVGKHDDAYKEYLDRLKTLRQRLGA